MIMALIGKVGTLRPYIRYIIGQWGNFFRIGRELGTQIRYIDGIKKAGQISALLIQIIGIKLK